MSGVQERVPQVSVTAILAAYNNNNLTTIGISVLCSKQCVELANVCCHDLQELHGQVLRARERLRHKRDILRACSRACGYSV